MMRNKWVLSITGIIILLIIWVGISTIAGSFFVPPPWVTLYDTAILMSSMHVWKQILVTFSRVIAGFLMAFILGTLIGIASGRREGIELIFKPITLFIQGVPPLLWAIPLIIILGMGHLSPVFVIALICFPLITLNVVEGMKSIPHDLEEMTLVFTQGNYPRIKEVVLPHLRPFLSASIKLGITLGIKASVVAEYFGANNGIGFQIQAAYQTLQIRMLFSWGLILILIIILTSKLLSKIIKEKDQIKWFMAGWEKKFKNHTISSVKKDILSLYEKMLSKRRITTLKLKNVSFSYHDQEKKAPQSILQSIDFTVSPDEIAVISGESGIGKTTLLKIIADILKPAQGTVQSPQKIGFVFQDDRLIPWRTVLRNTALPLLYQGFSKKDIICLSDMLLRETELKESRLKVPDELSGGMKKRVCLARCFASSPELILLDEPFAGLDKASRITLWNKFFELLESFSVPAVIVTHFPEELEGSKKCTFYMLKGNPAKLVKSS
ncbi:MAG: ATP-binding cassette domain-containing protein [Spirochaetota bacterium]|nr:MAG: ATP-binding cassette domain-containing protein [Spirochaetota bacterium]